MYINIFQKYFLCNISIKKMLKHYKIYLPKFADENLLKKYSVKNDFERFDIIAIC